LKTGADFSVIVTGEGDTKAFQAEVLFVTVSPHKSRATITT
jgi:hypothetical protein